METVGKKSGRAELSSVTRARAMAETRDGGHRRANTAYPWPGREEARTRDALTSPSSCTLASACLSSPTPPSWELQGKESTGHTRGHRQGGGAHTSMDSGSGSAKGRSSMATFLYRHRTGIVLVRVLQRKRTKRW